MDNSLIFTKSVNDTCKTLKVDIKSGLSNTEAKQRIKEFGYNGIASLILGNLIIM